MNDASPLKELLDSYAVPDSRFDEMLAAPGVPRPHWDPFLRALASRQGLDIGDTLSLVERGIRVNAVAPGPVWTPLIPASFSPEDVQEFGADLPLGRPAEPDEIAPCFVFLASEDSAFFVGQVLHPNGGEIINT